MPVAAHELKYRHPLKSIPVRYRESGAAISVFAKTPAHAEGNAPAKERSAECQL